MTVPEQRALIARALEAKAAVELACREFEDIRYQPGLELPSVQEGTPPAERIKLAILSPLLLLAFVTLALFEVVLLAEFRYALFKRRREIRAHLAEKLLALDAEAALPDTLCELWYRYGGDDHSVSDEVRQAVLTMWLGLLYPQLPDPLALVEERLESEQLAIRKFELALRDADSSACVSRSGCLDSVVEKLSAELGPWTAPVTTPTSSMNEH